MIDILIDPLVWMAIALVVSIVVALTLRQCFRCALLLGVLLIVLMVIASPFFANRWLGTLEDQYPSAACSEEAQDLPTVALAGGFKGGFSNLGLAQRLTEASKNRSLAAAKIVPSDGLLLLSGGSLRPMQQPAEAEAMAALVRPILADGVELVLETDSVDTNGNAAYVGALLDQMERKRHIVLISSAWHLPRAVATFERQGFEVCAHGVDPRQAQLYSWVAALPRVGDLQKTTIAIHEWAGILYYRHIGWH